MEPIDSKFQSSSEQTQSPPNQISHCFRLSSVDQVDIPEQLFLQQCHSLPEKHKLYFHFFHSDPNL